MVWDDEIRRWLADFEAGYLWDVDSRTFSYRGAK